MTSRDPDLRDALLVVFAALFTISSLTYMVVVVASAQRGVLVLVVEVVTWIAATVAVAYVIWSRTRWAGRDEDR